MQFISPYFLFALIAILIPVFIHLFNFRKYKSEYFSNVKFLKDILEKTKKESQLKHIIVLILRVLAIVFLVFAFAQPFIPNHKLNLQKGNLVTIFVDNSFSMESFSENGSLLKESTDAAKKIVNAFSYNDDFVLVTHDFSAKQSHLLNKDEILNEIDLITVTPKSKTQSEIFKFGRNIGAYSKKQNHFNYYISDFQKSAFDLYQMKPDSTSYTYFVPVQNEEVNNVSVDSCWFLSPVFKLGYQVTLTVRLRNFSKEDVVKIPVKLYINGTQKSLSAVDIKANSYADCQLNYTISDIGNQSCYVEINDAPIHFDDRLYFVYHVTENSNILVINESENKYLKALYGRDSVFNYTALNINQINYTLFNQSDLIVLDQIKQISSGLQDELKKYLESGGSILLFPTENMDFISWNNFLNSMETSPFSSLISGTCKVRELNIESIYYKGTLTDDYQQFNMPILKKYLKFNGSNKNMEPIMTLENGDPLLSLFPVSKGKLFISAVPLNDDYGNAHKNALMFVPLHNIALMNQIQNQLYLTIGKDEQIVVRKKNIGNEDVFELKSDSHSDDFIPEKRNLGNEVVLYFHSQINRDGLYRIMQKDDTVETCGFNYNRAESALHYYSQDEIEEVIDQSDGHVGILDFQSKDLTKSVSEKISGTSLWRYFLVLSLILFASEVLVLRFWGKPIYKK
jgi:hypothetical protein